MRTLPDADPTVLADSDKALANLHLAVLGVTRTFDVHDPATGQVIAQVPDFNAHQSLDAVDRADAAGRSWAATDTRHRPPRLARPHPQRRRGDRSAHHP